MVNNEALDQIKELEVEYEQVWGQKVDYTFMPPGITQEKLVFILERIVNTGESVLVGWSKLFKGELWTGYRNF